MTALKYDPITIISGATATGKTGYSIQLAQKMQKSGLNPVIINFDSLLFYKELTIGTAKPTMAERAGIEHQLIDINSAKDPLNAHQYIDLATPLINKYLDDKRPVILVGGSAFYIRALVKGMYDSPPISEKVKKQAEDIFQKEGIEGIRKILKSRDPSSFQKLHINDHYRNIRAVEHCLEHGTPLSNEQQRLEDAQPYLFEPNPHGWSLTHYYLSVEKLRHWDIILKRTKQMIQQGLIDEVENLLTKGFTGEEKPLQSIGYKETILFLKKEITSESDLIERIYIATRRLAKSQKTFFKKISPKQTIHL